MKKLTLKEIQEVSLSIMKEIHEFCVQNNIRYSLAYGSLIGAIRHKGFIPWDDDMDIVMPRPDYERFCRTYKGATTKIFASCIGNSYKVYGRVCDMNTTYVHPYVVWAKEKHGVWVDVFPVDGISCSSDEFKTYEKPMVELDSKLHRALNSKDKLSFHRGFIFNLKKAAKMIIYRNSKIEDIQKEILHLLPITDFETSEHCGQMVFPEGFRKQYHPTSWYKEYVLVDFCDTQFMVVKEYEKLLRQCYSDYMQYPPVEEQTPKHAYHLYFWLPKKKRNI